MEVITMSNHEKDAELNAAEQEVNQDNNITKDFSKDNEKTLTEIKDSFNERDIEHTEIAPEQEKQDVDNIRDIDLGNANEAFKNNEIEQKQIWTTQENQLVPTDKVFGQDLVGRFGQAQTTETDKTQDIEKDEPEK